MTDYVDEIDTSTPFLGICLRLPRGPQLHGLVRVIGRLKKVDTRWIVDPDFDLSAFGAGHEVFWPHQSDNFFPGWENCVVKLMVHTSEAREPHHRIRYRVHRNANHQLEIRPFGFPIVPGTAIGRSADGFFVKDAASYPEQVSGTFFFRHGERIVGPWRVARNQNGKIPPLTPARRWAMAIPTASLPGGAVFSFVGPEGTSREILLELPPDEAGLPVDAGGASEVAAWFSKQLQTCCIDVVERLDSQLPGWRDRFAELQATVEDPAGRKVHQTRWKRVEETLQRLEVDRDIVTKLMLSNARLRELLDEAIRKEVAGRAGEIRQKAEVVVAAELKRLNEEKARVQGEIERLVREVQDLEDLRKEVERDIAARKDDWEAGEGRLLEVASLLDGSKERIVSDFFALQALLESANAEKRHDGSRVRALWGGPDTGVVGEGRGWPASHGEESTSKRRRSRRLSGIPVRTSKDFVEALLWSHVRSRVPSASCGWARVFHQALLGCRLVMVPSLAWARSYCEAMGGTARMRVFSPDPTWLSFDEVRKVGLGAFWRDAVEDNSCLHLLAIDDVNKSMMLYWLKPILNALAGLSDGLVLGDEELPWSPNLRVICTVSGDEDAFPVPEPFIQAAGAIRRKIATAGDTSRPPLGQGHVLLQDWLGWVAPQPAVADLLDEVSDWGAQGFAASRDVLTLHDTLLLHGESEEKAESLARRIRLEWPLEYE